MIIFAWDEGEHLKQKIDVSFVVKDQLIIKLSSSFSFDDQLVIVISINIVVTE